MKTQLFARQIIEEAIQPDPLGGLWNDADLPGYAYPAGLLLVQMGFLQIPSPWNNTLAIRSAALFLKRPHLFNGYHSCFFKSNACRAKISIYSQY